MTEYVGFSHSEKKFGQKSFLMAQLEILDSLRNIGEYKKLRQEELVLKIALKMKINEMFQKLEELNRLMPKSSFKVETPEDKILKIEKEKKVIREGELGEEIARIRRQLERIGD